MAVHRFREGFALTLAHKKVGYGGWGAFLKQHGISSSSDDRARKLYEMAKSEKDLDGLQIMEAYERFGIEQRQVKANKAGTKPPTPPASPPKPLSQNNSKVGDPLKVSSKCPPASRPPDVHHAGASFGASRIMEEFNRFAESKGWDEDRKVQVLAQLSASEPVTYMIDEFVAVGFDDELISQLHQYFGQEPDYLSWLLSKVIAVSAGKNVAADALALVDQAIEQLSKIRKVATKEQAA
jgi:hypothetical protein